MTGEVTAVPPGAVTAAEKTLRDFLEPWLTATIRGTTLESQIHTAACIAARDAAAAERERMAALIPPERLRQLADWFDTDDEFKTTMFPTTWRDRGDEVQKDLRRWADLLDGKP